MGACIWLVEDEVQDKYTVRVRRSADTTFGVAQGGLEGDAAAPRARRSLVSAARSTIEYNNARAGLGSAPHTVRR